MQGTKNNYLPPASARALPLKRDTSDAGWSHIFTEADVYQKLNLPPFLLTYEEYQTLRIPAMRNFIFKQGANIS